jgi:hypothetical protein
LLAGHACWQQGQGQGWLLVQQWGQQELQELAACSLAVEPVALLSKGLSIGTSVLVAQGWAQR